MSGRYATRVPEHLRQLGEALIKLRDNPDMANDDRANERDQRITPAHLHDAGMHHIAHALQHARRLVDDDADEDSIGFNSDHAIHHIESAQDHMARLGEHLEEHPSDPVEFKNQRAELRNLRHHSHKEPGDPDEGPSESGESTGE
jgi:hypothetical protein